MLGAHPEYGNNGETMYHGSDSTVMIPRDSSHVFKNYNTLSIEEVSRYSQLHHLLSKEVFHIDLPQELQKDFGVDLQDVQVSFLDIGTDISVHFGLVRHTIKCIPGDTLSYFFHTNKKTIKKEFLQYLEKEISQFVAEKLGINTCFCVFMNSYCVVSYNIKVVSLDNQILSLCVTDIGSSISRLLSENREAIDKILQTSS